MTRGSIRGCAVFAALGSLGTCVGAAADLLAAWHFNGLTAPVGASIAADHGSGTLDLSAFGGTGLAWQVGTDLNAWPGDVAGEGLGVTGTGANGKSAVMTVGTVGYAGLSMSLAVRATATGHVSSVVEALNGESWVPVGGFTLAPSTWSTASFDLSSLSFLDEGLATLRVRYEGASSAQGNFRIDNARFEGSAVPAPAACGIAAVALLLVRRRRQ